jgi:hypothetical protein
MTWGDIKISRFKILVSGVREKQHNTPAFTMAIATTTSQLYRLALICSILVGSASSFQPSCGPSFTNCRRTTITSFLEAPRGFVLSANGAATNSPVVLHASRRDFLSSGGGVAAASLFALSVPTVFTPLASIAADDGGTFGDLIEQVKAARSQLDQVPKLIEAEKWDGVRSILAKPPLSDCWTKSARPLLPRYAQAVGEADGDELAALEAKEDAISHLRYLDMAVYNNIFNPIATEGTSGATKELVRSYYEDPTSEWKASKKAFDDLIELVGK